MPPVLRVAVLALGWWLSDELRFPTVALAVLGLLAARLLLGLD